MGKQIAILFLALIVSGCVAPVAYGPYYQPSYPQADRVGTPTLKSAVAPIAAPFLKPEVSVIAPQPATQDGIDVWIAGTPAQRLRFRIGHCFLGVRANAIRNDFVLNWTIEKTTGCNQNISIQQSPVVVEDLDTGTIHKPMVYARSLIAHEPGIPLDRATDLASKIPGFAEVPLADRKYLVSVAFTKYFNGKLPNQLSIQLPAIWMNGEKIVPPRISMKRQEEFLSRFSHYLPENAAEVTYQPYESQYRQWFDLPGKIALASVFWAWDDGKKWGDYYTSGIRGVIRFYVYNGSSIRLDHPALTWITDTQPEPADIPLKRFNLVEYSTTRYDDPLAAVFWGDDPTELYRGVGVQPDAPMENPRPIKAFEDTWITPLVRIPDFHPKRVKIILPRITGDGVEWPVKPIFFELREGSLELIDLM